VKSQKSPQSKEVSRPVLIRLRPELLEKINAWRRKQNDPPGVPAAIRQLVEAALEKGARP
jgi:hypothetical protein